MRKQDWLIVILPLFFTWGIDRITKMWALGLQGINFYGPLGFALHYNHGAMLGLFSDLPAVLRIVTLSTGGAFLLFLFVAVQYLLPIKSLTLRSGMSMLLGGILGNVVDRIIYGYVIDFILLGSMERMSPAFNMADALQWVGYALIGYALIRESEVLWPESNQRRFVWVNLKFQLRFCLLLMGIGFGFAAIAGVYSYTFLRVTIIDLIGNNERLLSHYLTPFILSFICVSLLFGGMLFMIGRLLSGRIAGPLYAFEKWLDDLSSGRPRVLRLRKGDEFRHLEEIAERVAQRAIQTGIFADAKVAATDGARAEQTSPPPAQQDSETARHSDGASAASTAVADPGTDGTEPDSGYVSGGDR
jgi:signal peptidase II